MNILYVIDSLGRGGAEQALVNLIPALRSLGHNCEVAALWAPYDVASDLEARDIRVHRLEVPNRWNLAAGAARVRSLADRGDFDVVHAHLYFAGLYTGLANGSRASHARVITFHLENYDAFPPNTVWRKARRRVDRWLLHHRFEGPTAVSTAVARHYERQLGVRPVSVFPNAFPTDSLAPARSLDRRSTLAGFGVSDDEFVIVNVARHAPEKGHTYLFEALALLAERGEVPRTLLFGAGPLRSDLESQIARHGLAGRVMLHDPLPHSRLMPIVQAADAFVMPSLWEGFPLAPAEAMAMETPVIATRVGGIPDLIEDGASGILVPPASPDGLAAAIGRLRSDPGLRQRIGRGGRQRLVEHFSSEAIASRWDKYYRDLVESRSDHPETSDHQVVERGGESRAAVIRSGNVAALETPDASSAR